MEIVLRQFIPVVYSVRLKVQYIPYKKKSLFTVYNSCVSRLKNTAIIRLSTRTKRKYTQLGSLISQNIPDLLLYKSTKNLMMATFFSLNMWGLCLNE